MPWHKTVCVCLEWARKHLICTIFNSVADVLRVDFMDVFSSFELCKAWNFPVYLCKVCMYQRVGRLSM